MRLISHAAACAGLSLCCASFSASAEDEGPITAELGGRLHWDFAQFDNDGRNPPNPDDTTIRRLWLDVSGKFYGWGYKIEADFADLQDDFVDRSVVARDVYVTRDFAAGKLTIGQFKQYFTLDDRISSNYGMMMERSMFASTLAPTYRMGAAWITAGDNHTIGGSVYSLQSINVWGSKGRGAGVRGTWTPLRDSERLVHLGVSLLREQYDNPGASGASSLRVAPRPTGYLSDPSRPTLALFGNGEDVDADKYSLEFGATRGPLYLQSELSGALFDSRSRSADIRSAYGTVGWVLTGETIPYDGKSGRFTRLKPSRSSGAWVLALRYDTIRGQQNPAGAPQLSDIAVNQTALGVNWHLRSNLRFMLDLLQSRTRDRLADRTLDRTSAVTGRFQYDF